MQYEPCDCDDINLSDFRSSDFTADDKHKSEVTLICLPYYQVKS